MKPEIAKKRKRTTIISLTAIIVSLVSIMIFVPMFCMTRKPISEVAFIPNTNNINDKSFNYETNKGVEKYSEDFEENVSIYVPSSAFPSNSDFHQIYTQAIQAGQAKTILGNSFSQAAPISGFCSDPSWDYGDGTNGPKEACELNGEKWTSGVAEEYPEVHFALLDDLTTAKYKNGLSVTFNSHEAGFMAGVAASIYSISTTPSPAHPTVGLWGGAAYNTVYDWMSGFEQAVNWFNYAILGYSVGGNTPTTTVSDVNQLVGNETASLSLKDKGLTTINTNSIYISGGKKGTETGWDLILTPEDYAPGAYTPSASSASQWFTGTFIPDDASSSKAKNIEDDGATSVFAVAGGQFQSALNDTEMAVIGVDTNLANSMPDYDEQNKIIGSATKNLALAAELALWVTYDYSFVHNDGITYQPGIVGTDGWTDKDQKAYEMATTPVDTPIASDPNTLGWVAPDSRNYSATPPAGVTSFEGIHLSGTTNNGGVSFVPSKAIQDPWSNFSTSATAAGISGLDAMTIDEFMDLSIAANTKDGVVMIESVSPTFALADSFNTGAKYAAAFPWSVPVYTPAK